MTQERLKEILEKHRKWLNGEVSGVKANLSDADFTGANLSSANLSSVNLSSVNLICANLEGANLRYANLEGANLEGANLRYANLGKADLRGANLEGANLRGANLIDVNLRGANLTDANLRGANLRGANLKYAIGNNKEVKTLQLGKYNITILVGIKIHIGCQNHTIEEWEKFTDEEISKMDNGALDWWKEWKEVILKVAKGE